MILSWTDSPFIITLLTVLCLLLPFLIAGFHFKRYGMIQGIFSLITLPMIVCGFLELFSVLFEKNQNMMEMIIHLNSGIGVYKNLQVSLLKETKIDWLYQSGWLYLPYALVYVITHSISIGIRHKKKKSA